MLEYKGYYAYVKIDFESDSTAGIVKEFHSAVDDYLEFCAEIGKTPAKPGRNFKLMRA